ncbi:MAG: polyprenyl synthetase family protein [Patescibacteria group bacterium]
MKSLPKNIRYYFRSVNFYVDEYLRGLLTKLPLVCHSPVEHSLQSPPEKREQRLPAVLPHRQGEAQGGGIIHENFAAMIYQCNGSMFDRPWTDNYTDGRDCFIAVTEAELTRGKCIDELITDPDKLLTFTQAYQQWALAQIRQEGLHDAETVRAISYLIEIISRKQKGGRRGVLKSRPVVFERVFSYLETTCSFNANFKYRLGGIIEIYNRATYAIDDVFDDSDYRGGEPTLHKIFSKRIAILVGQYLHMWSLELLIQELITAGIPAYIRAEVIRSFNIIHTSIYQMEKENYDLQEKLRSDLNFRTQYLRQTMEKNVSHYLIRVDLRTGKFYEHIVRMAALFATHNIAIADKWQTYGLGLGFRYLIDNDLKDLIDPYFVKQGTGSKGLKGKEHESFMGDLEIGKITYPVLTALKNKFDPVIIRMIGKKLTLSKKNLITKFVIDNGGVDATMQLMEHYADISKQVLKKFNVKDPTLWELTELYKFSNLPFEKYKL